MRKFYIVDRIEENYFVLESPDEKMVNIQKEYIEVGTREGDYLIRKGNYFIIDKKTTEIEKQKKQNKIKGMWV